MGPKSAECSSLLFLRPSFNLSEVGFDVSRGILWCSHWYSYTLFPSGLPGSLIVLEKNSAVVLQVI